MERCQIADRNGDAFRMTETKETEIDRRARTKELAAQHLERGDALGWFDALYKEAAGDNEKIPWADLEPNRYFRTWAEGTVLKGADRKALVVGCGLGDDARYLDDLGFKVTAFDISPTAIEWAKRLHADRDIQFEVMDVFEPFREWLGNFDFVLEVYTIQPLPLEMRARTIDSIAAFVAPFGELVVVTRGREDDEEPNELPWPMSRAELGRFADNGLRQISFDVMPGDDETPEQRFIVAYRRDH
ncbi:MAG TPA: SAM-dependent methyltransferase [Blastocatellia bacterium]|nr:SAM-dependent methyltransferase [Blastocatellia bacterium]